MLWVQSEIRASCIIWSVNEYPVLGVQIVERGRFFFFLSSWIFLQRSTVWTPGTGQAASERIYVQNGIIMIIMVSFIVVIITIRIIIKIINVIIIIIIIIIFALISPSLLDIKWTKVIMVVGTICKQLFSET